MAEAAGNASSPSTRQVALGLFVVFQLVFLLGSNFLDYAEHLGAELGALPPVRAPVPGRLLDSGHLSQLAGAVSGLLLRWAQLTEQPQGWPLYAQPPSVIPFVRVHLAWPGRQEVVLRAHHEPAGKRWFRLFRPRIAQLEDSLGFLFEARAGEPEPARRERLRDELRAKVAHQWPYLVTYLRLRVREHVATHPGVSPPELATLVVRFYRIPPPAQRPWDWSVETEVPVLRIRGEAVEVFDPVLERFEPKA